jgi:lipopolysaccharide/colanic/teichoic acid biosynthesis glycosyltransferase
MIRLLSTVVPVRVFTLFISEIILISTCFLAAAYVDPDLGDLNAFLLYDSGIFRIAVVVAFIVLALFAKNLYAEVRIRGRLALFQALCMILGLALIGQGVIGYFDPSWIVPRKVMLPGSILAVAVIFGWRLLFDRAAQTAVAAGRVLFLGTSPAVARIAGHFAEHPELGLIAIGYIESGAPAAFPPAPRLGTMADLDSVLDQSVPDSIVIGNREDIRPWWADEFLALRFGGVRVQEAGTLYERVFARKCLTEISPSKAIFGDSQLSAVDVDFQSLYSWPIALAAGLITLPLTLTVAALIKISCGGPVLKRETRVGLNGLTFDAYRFSCTGEDGADTPVGKFLQRYGLVWLPQLLNVLKGQMAMVGPRPERPLFARRMDELIPIYQQRRRVKPGVTGWARIHRRRGESQDSLRDLEYDLYYIENLSPLVDWFILLLSLRRWAVGVNQRREIFTEPAG